MGVGGLSFRLSIFLFCRHPVCYGLLVTFSSETDVVKIVIVKIVKFISQKWWKIRNKKK